MSNAIVIRVNMTPVPQPRQRHRIVAMKGKKPFVQSYTPKSHPVQVYKRALRDAASRVYRGAPLACPLRCDLLFVMPRTQAQTWKTKPMPRLPHNKKPDRDNLDKACLDALTGIMWTDDAKVFDGRITKVVAAGDEQPHVLITITPL